MTRLSLRAFACVALSVALTVPVSAHVTLEQREAPVGAFYKAVFRVPHGCASSPTMRLRVRIPEGVISVKPMMKPGWQIEIMKGPYQKVHSFLHGATFAEGVTEVTWSGGRLPDAYYDEFVLSTFIAGDLATGRMLYFPVVQDCEKGTHNWTAEPAADHANKPDNDPAPGDMLVPNK